jgi:hypothetical protein
MGMVVPVMFTVGTTTGFTVRVMLLEVAVVLVAQVMLVVSTQEMTSPLASAVLE